MGIIINKWKKNFYQGEKMEKRADRKRIRNKNFLGLVKTNLSEKRDLSARQPHFLCLKNTKGWFHIPNIDAPVNLEWNLQEWGPCLTTPKVNERREGDGRASPFFIFTRGQIWKR